MSYVHMTNLNLMKKIFLILAIATFAASCSNSEKNAETTAVTEASEAGDANVLTVNESILGWTANKLTGEHFGKIQIADGQLYLGDEGLSGGNFTIDMTTIVVEDLEDPEYNKKLTDHLFSEDFFNVENFNQGGFAITAVETMDAADEAGNTHFISGNLTLKGITQGIRFPAQVEVSNEGVKANANFNIDRTLWDIKYRSGKFFPEIGDKIIMDEIGINLELKASRG